MNRFSFVYILLAQEPKPGKWKLEYVMPAIYINEIDFNFSTVELENSWS